MNGKPVLHKRVQYYACRELDVLYQDFHAAGYTDEQAEKMQQKYGRNILHGRASDSVLYRLQRAFINPFSIILFVLAVISFITDVVLASNFSRNMTTVLIILSMLLLSGCLRFVQEMRAKRTAEHLTEMISSNVWVYRNNAWAKLASQELAVGDIVRLSAGDRVPADIRLTMAKNVFVSQAVITGESDILEKNTAAIEFDKTKACKEYTNTLFMGSSMIGGICEGIVLAVGNDTVYGGFADTDKKIKDGFNKGANSIAWVLIRFMTILVPVVFLACGITKGNWLAAFLFALSVAVGLTPEMLPMVVNACLAKGGAAMGRKQTVVKNINAMQGFGSMDILCVDKTGTLTGDKLLLEYYIDILGNESNKVLDFAYLNSLYHTGIKNHLDTAILQCQEMPGSSGRWQACVESHAKLDELPFDYERRLASVLVKDDDRNLLIVKGSIDEVCQRCDYIEYKGQCQPINTDKMNSVHAVVDEMLEDGMKVLAVAYKFLDHSQLENIDEENLVLLGYLVFFDAPKTSAHDAICKLKNVNVGIRVLTGDQKSVGISICRRIGIDTKNVLTGKELEVLNDDEALVKVENTTVFAELSPKQKVQILQILQENGHTVGFLGDGMNDLPAIVAADVGISVDTAVEAVKECADVVLLKKDLRVLEAGIEEGRKAFANMIKYIKITASSNFGNIFSIVIASVFLPFLPMTALQLLLLNLLYDILCLALPWDKVDTEIISKSLDWSGKNLGRFMMFFGAFSSVFDILTFIYLFFFFCPALCGGSFNSLSGQEEQNLFIAAFHTGWFLESMWTQVLILHLLRTKKIPLLQSKPAVSVMCVTTMGILLFTMLTFTSAGSLIGLTALPVSYFGFLCIVVVGYLCIVTVAKKWYVRKYRKLF